MCHLKFCLYNVGPVYLTPVVRAPQRGVFGELRFGRALLVVYFTEYVILASLDSLFI